MSDEPYNRLPVSVRRRSDLSGDAKVTIVCMAEHEAWCVSQGGENQVSKAWIAKETGGTEASVRRVLRELMDAKLLSVTYEHGTRVGTVATWKTHLPDEDQATATPCENQHPRQNHGGSENQHPRHEDFDGAGGDEIDTEGVSKTTPNHLSLSAQRDQLGDQRTRRTRKSKSNAGSGKPKTTTVREVLRVLAEHFPGARGASANNKIVADYLRSILTWATERNPGAPLDAIATLAEAAQRDTRLRDFEYPLGQLADPRKADDLLAGKSLGPRPGASLRAQRGAAPAASADAFEKYAAGGVDARAL